MRILIQLLIVTFAVILMGCSATTQESVLEDYAWQARSEADQNARPFKDAWTADRIQSVLTDARAVPDACRAFEAGHTCPAGSDPGSRITDDGLRCAVYCVRDGVIENGMFLTYSESPVPTIEKGPFIDGKRSGAWSKLQVPSRSASHLIVTEVRHYREGILDGRSTRYLDSGSPFAESTYVEGVRGKEGDEPDADLYGGI